MKSLQTIDVSQQKIPKRKELTSKTSSLFVYLSIHILYMLLLLNMLIIFLCDLNFHREIKFREDFSFAGL